MQSDRHAAVIARDCWNSKALFAQSLAAMDFAGRMAVARPFLADGRPLDF